MFHHHRHNALQAGFTLMEMMIVLLVVSIVLAGLLPFVLQERVSDRIQLTIDRMNDIDAAINDFIKEYKRLPCPAVVNTPMTDSTFGEETATPGTCAGASWDDGTATVGGMIPTRTLRLPDDYAYDGWGRRMTYHVDNRLTHRDNYGSSNVGSITIRNLAETDATDISAYVVLSHGENGHGAYLRSGARYDGDSTSTHEHENCDCDADLNADDPTAPTPPFLAPSAAGYDPVFFRHMHGLEDDTDPNSLFDDIVRSRMRGTLPYAP